MKTTEFDSLNPGDTFTFTALTAICEFRGYGPRGWMTYRQDGRVRRIRVYSNTVTLMDGKEEKQS